jgi:hypothetical protein
VGGWQRVRHSLAELELDRRFLCDQLLGVADDEALAAPLAAELAQLAAGLREEAAEVEAAVHRARRRTPSAAAEPGCEVSHRHAVPHGAWSAGEGADGEVPGHERRPTACAPR